MITEYVRYGVYSAKATLVGCTLAQVRQAWSTQWGIPPFAVASVSDHFLPDTYVVQSGDVVLFHYVQGGSPTIGTLIKDDSGRVTMVWTGKVWASTAPPVAEADLVAARLEAIGLRRSLRHLMERLSREEPSCAE